MALASTNQLMDMLELTTFLQRNPHTNAIAVIEIPSEGATVSGLTNVIRTLRANGFTAIEIVRIGRGLKFRATGHTN